MSRAHRALTALATLLLFVSSAACAQQPRSKATEGMVGRAKYEVVDCSLPGEVRVVGGRTYISARRPTRTTADDCHIRGGEYVAYDRADYKSALNVWMETAQQGDAEAQNNVGEIYERGAGGQPNYEAAIIWYEKAAAQNNSRALFNLGTLYEQGLGVQQDRLKALNYYRRSWGLTEDNVIFESASQREIAGIRAELTKQVSDKDAQIALLRKRLEELEAEARKRASANDTNQKELETLRGLLGSLETERSKSENQLRGLPNPTSVVSLPTYPTGDSQPPPVTVKGLEFGRYYALVIGNQNYKLLGPLQTPLTDADRAAQVLREKYGFSVRKIEDADDAGMLQALNDLYAVLKPNDNLLVYYAGHGTRRQTTGREETGYWQPINAQPASDTYWVPNEQVTSHLARLQARRILVVADSCYAGLLSADPGINIFGNESQLGTEYVKYKLPKRARLLLASGGDQPVLDVGGEGNSVFARAFLDVLNANTGVLSTPALFAKVQERVKIGAARSNFSQTPEFKAIKAAGHEMGDFFFVPLKRGS
jgi:uncharacterized caspase-like protein